MKRLSMIVLLAGIVFVPVAVVMAHCEVPCGIYGDQRRFEEMLEDGATISKAIDSIRELSTKSDANSRNQLARWVATKESHATNTQHIIAQYFMAQRIKSDGEGYEGKLISAHKVLVAAMKCKQSAEPATAIALEGAIKAFHRVYEGK